MPQRIEEGDACYILGRVGKIDAATGLAFVATPRMGSLANEWCGWDRHVVSLGLLVRAPEPRDIHMPREIEPEKVWKPGG